MKIQANNQNKPGCIIHCRVSTSKQAYEGESLDVQCDVCKRLAAARGWTLLHAPWKESYSWRKVERPVFDEILAFIDAHPGQVQYYIFRSIDRFTRSGVIEYERMKREIESRGIELIDSLGLIQPSINTLEHLGIEFKWSRVRPSKTAEMLEAEKANQEISTILTRLIGQEISLRRRGYKIREAADGFVNVKIDVEGRKRVVERPDPERAKYYTSMFELRAAGQLTDEQICEQVNAMGFRSRERNVWNGDKTEIVGRKGGTPLTPRRLLEAIARPIYCGLICERWTNWQPIKAAYDGLVSIETFNAANRGKIEIVQGPANAYEMRRGTPGPLAARRSKTNPLFPLRCVIRCSFCRKAFLGSSPRGRSGQRFPTYHCGRNHKYFGVPKAELERAVSDYIRALRFRAQGLSCVRWELVRRYNEQSAKVQEAAEDAHKNISQMEARKSEAVKAFKFATSEAMRRGLEAEVEEIERQQKSALGVSRKLRISEDDIDGYLSDARKIVEHPSILLENPANPSHLEAAYHLTFDELPTYAEIVSRTPKLAWIFSLDSDFDGSKPALVRQRVPEWNHIEASILRWKAACGASSSLFPDIELKTAVARPASQPPQHPHVPSRE